MALGFVQSTWEERGFGWERKGQGLILFARREETGRKRTERLDDDSTEKHNDDGELDFFASRFLLLFLPFEWRGRESVSCRI